MTKVYIKFGELSPNEDHIYVYEGLLENDVVRIILPSASYLTCQTIAKDIELPAYIVEGIYIGCANNGQPALREYNVISKLSFDQYKECYIYNGAKKENIEIPIEKSKTSDIPEVPDSVPKWMKKMINIGYNLEGKHHKIGSNQNNLHTFKKNN